MKVLEGDPDYSLEKPIKCDPFSNYRSNNTEDGNNPPQRLKRIAQKLLKNKTNTKEKVARLMAFLIVSNTDENEEKHYGFIPLKDLMPTTPEENTKFKQEWDKLKESDNEIKEIERSLNKGNSGFTRMMKFPKVINFDDLAQHIEEHDLKLLSGGGGSQLRRLKQYIVATELRGGGRDLEARRAFNARLRELSQ